MPLIIDTSVIIDFLRQEEKITTWLYLLSRSKNQLFASIITHTELFAGKSIWEKKSALQELKTIFSGIKLVPINETISQIAGKIRAEYDLDLIDAIIAATALNQNIPLATLNSKHFASITHLKLLTPSSQQN
ncbi:MAG: hypothetical protein A2784_03595 [Candidatus Chisholmbacteria bacterium RIFCSPHIGHO2_01_FULL_48_12]|uniref:PIN domain-containing protein n=1 Tax=Candidatus Chisholmbacteria bacterium RIFCSPHIGHO2_01_FULL_48_12 TaxID=1797589 RepID=A0A1G1VPZ1_9BACT|nr:MAG: hypothetical protein A2784_03595 [Candidatus Chisholmbacteria bacterium RIFCSPHIGHO2_01_FULL_48_12]